MTKRRHPQLRDEPRFRAWAESAVRGLDDSATMVGIFGDQNRGARLEFALQIGHCILEEKPIVLCVPEGVRLPEKLVQVAAAIARYNPALGPAALHEALKAALERIDHPVRQ